MCEGWTDWRRRDRRKAQRSLVLHRTAPAPGRVRGWNGLLAAAGGDDISGRPKGKVKTSQELVYISVCKCVRARTASVCEGVSVCVYSHAYNPVCHPVRAAAGHLPQCLKWRCSSEERAPVTAPLIRAHSDRMPRERRRGQRQTNETTRDLSTAQAFSLCLCSFLCTHLKNHVRPHEYNGSFSLMSPKAWTKITVITAHGSLLSLSTGRPQPTSGEEWDRLSRHFAESLCVNSPIVPSCCPPMCQMEPSSWVSRALFMFLLSDS